MTKAEEMETVTPTVTFLGFPFGGKGMWFKADKESIPIRKSYARLLRDKGLVEWARQLAADESAKADAEEKSEA